MNDETPIISDEHTEYSWQSINDLDELDFIGDLKDKIKEGYKLYKGI